MHVEMPVRTVRRGWVFYKYIYIYIRKFTFTFDLTLWNTSTRISDCNNEWLTTDVNTMFVAFRKFYVKNKSFLQKVVGVKCVQAVLDKYDAIGLH